MLQSILHHNMQMRISYFIHQPMTVNVNVKTYQTLLQLQW